MSFSESRRRLLQRRPLPLFSHKLWKSKCTSIYLSMHVSIDAYIHIHAYIYKEGVYGIDAVDGLLYAWPPLPQTIPPIPSPHCTCTWFIIGLSPGEFSHQTVHKRIFNCSGRRRSRRRRRWRRRRRRRRVSERCGLLLCPWGETAPAESYWGPKVSMETERD